MFAPSHIAFHAVESTALTSCCRWYRNRWAYEAPSDISRIASIAPVVVECAMANDAVAETILRHGVGELFRAVKTVTNRLGLDTGPLPVPFKLVLAGRMLEEGSLYAQFLIEVIRDQVSSMWCAACSHEYV